MPGPHRRQLEILTGQVNWAMKMPSIIDPGGVQTVVIKPGGGHR